MSRLRRIVLIRHGETAGNSSTRFHGSNDVPLSDEGRDHMRQAASELRGEVFDLVVASPLRRSWEGAHIASGGAPVRLEDDFREIDFGRWEGMTAEEIRVSDPVLYEDWQAKANGFQYPGGEARADFVARVERGLDRMLEGGASSALLVVHKGIVRTIVEKLLKKPLEDGVPELGGIVSIGRDADDSWFEGRRSSNPPALEQAD
jgi:broad specificity phosphatase PhoE